VVAISAVIFKMNSEWIHLKAKNGNVDLVYDSDIAQNLDSLVVELTPAKYKDLVGMNRDDADIKALIDANFWKDENADDDAADADFDAADPRQLVAFMKEESEAALDDEHAWATIPLFLHYQKVVDDIGDDVIDSMYSGRVVSRTQSQMWMNIVNILVYMSYPAAFTVTAVDAPVVAEPSVTPEQSLAQRLYNAFQSVAAIPVKAAAAVSNIVMGEPVAQNVAAVVDAVIEPVAAAVEVVAPVPETKPTPVMITPAVAAPLTNPYDMPFTTSASPVQQAANAVTAMLTGSTTTAVTGRTDFDRAKSKFYRAYRNQPNGRTADRNKAAKTVVTDVAKYVPKRNDFKGLDDRTGVGAFAPSRKRK
jgi:hypothetical protein